MLTNNELAKIRRSFPILDQEVNGEPLVYFDNAATSQKPQSVIDCLVDYYQNDNANIHRGVHQLAERATGAYEGSRQKVATFIGANDSSEVIFNRGTTEGINFLARGLVEPMLEVGDQVMTTLIEHHSNFVPWQEVCHRTGAQLVFAPLDEGYQVDMDALERIDTSKVKVLAINHVSNILGISQPIQSLVEWAHDKDIMVIVDGAQAVAHQRLNLADLGVDAYCFSGHKMFAATGIGVTYLNRKWHRVCQPTLFGGEMIHQVGDYVSNYKEAPWKYEGGTPPIAQAISLLPAIDFIESIGWSQLHSHEEALVRALYQGLNEIEGIQLYQTPAMLELGLHGIVSFNIEDVHPHDASTGYDMEGIALRAGHHCGQPLMRHFGVAATLRASVSVYNTLDEVAQFIDSTRKVKEFFTDGFI
ncbi:SufS family cysteine desulfurase [Hutsoniella sourekii]